MELNNIRRILLLAAAVAMVFLALYQTTHGQFPVQTVRQGGTGTSTIESGHIPFGNTALRIDTDSGFTWNNVLKKLTATNASTTDLSVSGNTYANNIFASTIGALANRVTSIYADTIYSNYIEISQGVKNLLLTINVDGDSCSGSTLSILFNKGSGNDGTLDYDCDDEEFIFNRPLSASNLSGTNTGDVTLAGENYLSLSGQQITANAVNLATSNVTGNLPVANGGTGKTSFTAGQVLFGELAQDSNLFWDNTNKRLGIGTETPGSLLHIRENNTGTGSTVGLTIGQAGTGDAILKFNLEGTRFISTGIDNSDADSYVISHSSTLGTNNIVRLTTNGLLGIDDGGATGSADTGLNIIARRRSSTYNNSRIIFAAPRSDTADGSTATNRGYLVVPGSSASTESNIFLGANTTNAVTTGDAAAIRSGNQSVLEITSAGLADFWRSGTNYARINGNGSSYFNGGNVGIGTTAPAVKLTVKQSSSLTDPAGMAASVVGLFQGSGNAQLTIANSGAGTLSVLSFGNESDYNPGGIQYNTSNHSMSFRTNDTSDRIIINSSGQVGIGTSPSTLFHLGSAGTAQMRMTGANGNTLFRSSQEFDIVHTRTSGEAILDFQGISSDGTSGTRYRFGLTTGSTGQNQINLFQPNSTTLQTVLGTSGMNSYINAQGGNLGIGTTGPANILHLLTANGTASYLRIQQTGWRTWTQGIPASSADYVIRDETGSIEALRIQNATGVVGVRQGLATSGTNANLGGTIHTNVTPSTVGATTSETDMMSYTVPANTLGTNGDRLEVKMGGYVDTTNDDIDINIYVNGSVVQLIRTFNGEAGKWLAEFTILRTGSATQLIMGEHHNGSALGGLDTLAFKADATATLSSTFVIKATARKDNASDVARQDYMIVDWQPAK